MYRVTGTLSLISFLGFSSQLFIILPTHNLDLDLVKLLLPFNFLLGLLYWNYFLTSRTGAGRVPKGWVSFAALRPPRIRLRRSVLPATNFFLPRLPLLPQEPDTSPGSAFEVKRLTGGARHCRTCKGQSRDRLSQVSSGGSGAAGQRMFAGTDRWVQGTKQAIVTLLQPTSLRVRITAASASGACSGWTTTVSCPAPNATRSSRGVNLSASSARRPLGRQLVRPRSSRGCVGSRGG